MRQLDDLTHTQVQIVQGRQVLLHLAYRQPQCRAQIGHQRRHAHPDPPLPEHLPRQIQLRAAPAHTVRTPALDYLMFDHFHGLRRRQFNHLAAVIQALACQAILALRTARQCMPFDARRLHALPRRVVLSRALLARPTTRRLLPLRLHECRRIASPLQLRFQRIDPRQRGS